MVNDDLGSSNGALIFDETGFIKKGKASIGVARQYCGTIGKVDNCQVGVFAVYASEHGYAIVDKRLFIPDFGLEIPSLLIQELPYCPP
jgi:SRSO17 transposase